MKLEDASQFALSLMRQHGLVEPKWGFSFHDTKTAMGSCRHPSIFRAGCIFLSRYFVLHNEDDEIRDTVLHEIAHALAGRGAGHGPLWRGWAVQVGARPQRCGDAEMPDGRYQAQCRGCQKVWHKHRRPRCHIKYSCPKCGRERGALLFREVRR